MLDSEASPLESSTGAHNKGSAYRAVVILVASKRGSGARSLRSGAPMPDGKPWVVRMGSHREPRRATRRGRMGRIGVRSPSLQRTQEVDETSRERSKNVVPSVGSGERRWVPGWVDAGRETGRFGASLLKNNNRAKAKEGPSLWDGARVDGRGRPPSVNVEIRSPPPGHAGTRRGS